MYMNIYMYMHMYIDIYIYVYIYISSYLRIYISSYLRALRDGNSKRENTRFRLYHQFARLWDVGERL
jgi:hypothetical protein